MKRLMICLLLLGATGCGQPETEQQAYVVLKKLGAVISKNDGGQIDYLSLGGLPITDADLAHLKPLKKLEILGLYDSKISGDGILDSALLDVDHDGIFDAVGDLVGLDAGALLDEDAGGGLLDFLGDLFG